MQHIIVSYNNAFRIMHSLSMRCSAILMFISFGNDICNTRIRKCMYSLMRRIPASTNKNIEYMALFITPLYGA